MKNNLKLALLCIFIFCIYSCHKDSQNQHTATGPEPVKPDLAIKVSSSVSGYVMNESGNPVVFASVLAGGQQVTTDKYGYFSIPGTSLSQIAGFVKVSSTGYFNGYRTFLPQEGKETFLRIQLLAKTDAGTVDAASGGEVTTTDGGKVVLPAGGIVAAAGGAAYTGQVHVSMRWIDPADGSTLQTGMPGDSRGTDSAGYLKALKSYGALAVELTGNNGQLLQIAPGKTAGIYIPISSALSSITPASVALWSFNDSTGLWKQEGTAVKTGNVLCGNTSHFSFWDGAEGASLVNFKARVLDAASKPLVHVPVSVTLAGMPQNAGFGRFGYTDADGNVSGAVMANSSLVVDVLTPCAISAYSHPFTTASADVDLGLLTGNMGQNEVTISGTVINCSKQPVTSGYVQTYDHGFYNRIPINNGSFSFTGIACTNLAVNVVTIDNAANQQGDPRIVTLASGMNDLGVLTACGTSTMGSISFTIDGVTTTITEPKDTIGAYFLLADNSSNRWTQIVTLSGNANQSPQMSFQFDGGNAVGNAHAVTDVFSNKFSSGRGYWPVPVPVTISEYGEIGGFISGTYSGNMIEFDNSAVRTFSCTFRVRRYN